MRIVALALLLIPASAAAQQVDLSTRCPSLPSGKASLKKELSRTPDQAEADKLAAEAQTLSRSPSRENVAKAIAVAEQALKHDPENVTAYLVLARSHANSKRYKMSRARSRPNEHGTI